MEYVRQMPCDVLRSWPKMARPQAVCHQVKSSVRGVIILFDGVDVDVCLIDVFGVDACLDVHIYINSNHNLTTH